MNKSQLPRVTFNGLVRGFFNAGLQPGDHVLVHSSLSSFGRVADGPGAIPLALMDVVGESGLVVMPAFTYGKDIFDAARSISQTGKIPETFRLMPGVVRSLHPTHSVSAWGKNCRELVAGHENVHPFATGSPLHKFLQLNGKILLVGVTHTANSILHLAQELAHVPYLDRPKQVRSLDNKGNVQTVTVRRAGCSLGFDKIMPFLEEKRLEKRAAIGKASVRTSPAKEVVDVAVRLFEENPHALLCDRADCFACNEARTMSATRKAEIV